LHLTVFRSLWFGNSQIPADFTGEEFIDLRMPWYSGTAVGHRIAPPRMIAAFADENATLRGQMPD
jgi:hypothetical protein